MMEDEGGEIKLNECKQAKVRDVGKVRELERQLEK